MPVTFFCSNFKCFFQYLITHYLEKKAQTSTHRHDPFGCMTHVPVLSVTHLQNSDRILQGHLELPASASSHLQRIPSTCDKDPLALVELGGRLPVIVFPAETAQECHQCPLNGVVLMAWVIFNLCCHHFCSWGHPPALQPFFLGSFVMLHEFLSSLSLTSALATLWSIIFPSSL